jgi:hypothetical protein
MKYAINIIFLILLENIGAVYFAVELTMIDTDIAMNQ